ncbi:MAG: FliI/YscN family ATPase [Caulobacterales bacterium]
MSRHPYLVSLGALPLAERSGFVRKVAPSHVEATGPFATLGDLCEIDNGPGRARTLAEVAAVEDNHIVLVPLDQTIAILPDAKVWAAPSKTLAPVGDAFAGRLIDALGEPIDGGASILSNELAPIVGKVLQPLERKDPNSVLETGLRALDGLLTIGKGQRIGVFAASGVGKTTLVRQLATQVSAKRCVLCLVGERGREVETMWRELSSQADAKKYACVAATSDLSPALRVRAVYQALSLAEYWRGAGEDVLLILDSTTRFAMALREIGLAAGAPPTLRAYTPNVFSALPRIVERCGSAKSGGSITAIMTVLSETDDVDDPIVEVMKSLLDGHIILSRQLAEQGHFPAIDVPRSISRQSPQLMAGAHASAARRTISALSAYEEGRIMVESGIYKSGANPRLDAAIRSRSEMTAFLRQSPSQRSAFAETLAHLTKISAGVSDHA